MTTYTQTVPLTLTPARAPQLLNKLTRQLKAYATAKTLAQLSNHQRRDIGLLPKANTPALRQPLW